MKALEALKKEFTPQQFMKLTHAIQGAVMASVQTQGQTINRAERGITASETDRRIDLCVDWALERRFDGGWSVERICDKMKSFLRDRLDSKIIAPDGARWWGASDA